LNFHACDTVFAFAGVIAVAAPLCEECPAENRYCVQFANVCALAGATATRTNIAAAATTLTMYFTALPPLHETHGRNAPDKQTKRPLTWPTTLARTMIICASWPRRLPFGADYRRYRAL
jgi:hypothetical protein